MENTEKNESTTTEIVVSADFTETEKALRVAEHKHKDIVHDVTTKQGMKAAKADVSELRTMRTTVDKKRLEVGRVLLAEKAKIDDKAKAIIGRIVALEEPLKLQVEAEEARVEAERLAALEAERVRVETILAKIAAFRELPGKVAGWPSSRIATELTKAQAATVTEDEYQEHTAQAQDAHAACVARLQAMHADAQAREAEAERTRKLEEEHAAQQAELEKLRREAAEAQAKREREAAEREAAEQRRIADIMARVRNIRMAATDLEGRTSKALMATRDQLETMHPAKTGGFGEFQAEAVKAFDEAMEAIAQAIEPAMAEEARQKAELEDQERRAQDAEKARKEAEAKAAKARQDAEKAKAAEKSAKLASIGLRKAVEIAHDYFVEHGVADLREQMEAAMRNDTSEQAAKVPMA